jgi:hypothetical protein
MLNDITTLAIPLVSLLIALVATFIAQSALTQARQVASRDERNWRQRQWFDLLIKAERARNLWERIQTIYPYAQATPEYAADQHDLMLAMREALTYASVLPINSAINKFFDVIKKLDKGKNVFSKPLLSEMVDAIDDLREKAFVHPSVLGRD